MGKLYVVGIGPGSIENMTQRAIKAIEESQVIVGYTKYIEYIKPLINNKEVVSTGMKKEEDRCREALLLSKTKTVSIISTGDAGIYGMAGLIYEMRENEEIEVIPGITASSSAGSIVGAPLMHDSCNISLSDLMTPYELIKKRVQMAGEGDFVVSLYNPRSKGRSEYLRESIEELKKWRKDETPVAIVRNALREDEEVTITNLKDFDDSKVDMFSIVIIGNSTSYLKGNIFITPRGYKGALK